ncbi:MAG: hypothetical protein V4632_05105 [Pseudomonadota bacterium]
MIDDADEVTRPLPVATATPIRVRFAASDRLYTIILMQDLFEQWMIMQSWGGKQDQSGGGKTRPFDSLDAGLAALAAIVRQHQKRGHVQLD